MADYIVIISSQIVVAFFGLADYTLFFLHWIKPLQERSGFRYNPNYWLNLSKKPGYRSWAGYAFEAVCMKHIDQILKKPGPRNRYFLQ